MRFALDLTAVEVLNFVINSMTKIGTRSRLQSFQIEILPPIEYAGK